MATASIKDSRLRLTFNAGIDTDGNPIVKYKSFNNVKTAALTDQLYNIVTALAPLQQHELSFVERNDSYSITAA
jgi:hypothetical protein